MRQEIIITVRGNSCHLSQHSTWVKQWLSPHEVTHTIWQEIFKHASTYDSNWVSRYASRYLFLFSGFKFVPQPCFKEWFKLSDIARSLGELKKPSWSRWKTPMWLRADICWIPSSLVRSWSRPQLRRRLLEREKREPAISLVSKRFLVQLVFPFYRIQFLTASPIMMPILIILGWRSWNPARSYTCAIANIRLQGVNKLIITIKKLSHWISWLHNANMNTLKL